MKQGAAAKIPEMGLAVPTRGERLMVIDACGKDAVAMPFINLQGAVVGQIPAVGTVIFGTSTRFGEVQGFF